MLNLFFCFFLSPDLFCFRAFEELQSWFVNATKTRCLFDQSNSTWSRSERNYLKNFFQITANTVNKLKITACSGKSAATCCMRHLYLCE